jgi:hypothetical protein
MHDLDDALQSSNDEDDNEDDDENPHQGLRWDPDLVEAMLENHALFHKQLHELRHQVVGGMLELPGVSSTTAEVPGDIAVMDVDAICQPYYYNNDLLVMTTRTATEAEAAAAASYYTSAGPANHGARNGDDDDDGATDDEVDVVDAGAPPGVRTSSPSSGTGGSDAGYYYGEGIDEDHSAGFYLWKGLIVFPLYQGKYLKDKTKDWHNGDYIIGSIKLSIRYWYKLYKRHPN